MRNKKSLLLLFLVLARLPICAHFLTTDPQAREWTEQSEIEESLLRNYTGHPSHTRAESYSRASGPSVFVTEGIRMTPKPTGNGNKSIDSSDLDPHTPEQEMNKVLDETKKLCPYTSYCGSEPLLNNTDPIKIPCCQECSCDPECGRHGDCCHSNLDTYKLKDKYEMKCMFVKSGCFNRAASKSYYMIDKCLETNISCYDRDDRHRTFYPAYSPFEKLNFYNKQCSVCNNVNDTLSWTSSVSCGHHFEYLSTPENLALALQNGKCDINFEPPNIMPENHFACSETFTDTCDAEGSSIQYSEITKAACETVLSPVRMKDRAFANIHCMHCNNVISNADGLCLFLDDCRASSGMTFSIIIDYKSLKEVLDAKSALVSTSRNARTNTVVCGKNFVKHPYKNECRPLLCPYGRYTLDGDCRLFSETWHADAIVLVLLFTFERDVAEKGLIWNKGKEVEILLRRNKLYWKNIEILYSKSQDANSTTVTSLMIILEKDTRDRNFDLAKILENTDKLLQSNLIINIGNKGYKTNIEIDRGFRYRQDFEAFTLIKRLSSGVNDTATETFYRLLGSFWYQPYGAVPLWITKLFFCPIVKIFQAEFKETNSEFVLFPNETNSKVLFPGERIRTIDSGLYVCAEDFNSNWWTENSEGQALTSNIEVYVVSLLFGLCIKN